MAAEQHDGLSIRREVTGAVLITGGLGFLGSVVLESLLRSCPQVLHLSTLPVSDAPTHPRVHQRLPVPIALWLISKLR
jgi:nucleoside-diphosphate-sugar epimerase